MEFSSLTSSARPLDGASPLSVFEAVGAAALLALPSREFALAAWTSGAIGPDIHVKVGKALYSVPWRQIGWRVDARSAGDMVQIFDDGQLITPHVRKPFGKQTDVAHYPPEKIAFRRWRYGYDIARQTGLASGTLYPILGRLTDRA